MGVARPGLCRCGPIAGVLAAAGGIGQVERCLVYAPDAMGAVLFASQADLLSRVSAAAPVTAALRSVFPPKTPVCFASMFTGAPPEVHGIRAYERPVLECDTLFDSLIRAGKRPAIVSVKDASTDIIFRGRDMDYFSEPADDDVTARAIELLESDRHDLILVYHQEYDDLLHESEPFAAGALAAAGRHVDAFSRLAMVALERWRGRQSLVAFAPDHGAHVDPRTGRGAHGEDMPDDMEVLHFFAFQR